MGQHGTENCIWVLRTTSDMLLDRHCPKHMVSSPEYCPGWTRSYYKPADILVVAFSWVHKTTELNERPVHEAVS